MSETKWLVETLHRDVRMSLAADTTLFQDKGEHQDLVLVENSTFGKVLMLDGAVQVTTADEFVYHEMMAHVPLIAHGAARRVLIVGGGDGGLAEEVLKHDTVERLVQVEIDGAVVDFAKAHFSDINAGVFDDPRFSVVIADGARFVAETDERFDVILIDSTDPHGPGAVLFTSEFYRDLKRCLEPGGVVVTQNGVPFLQKAEFQTAMSRLRGVFDHVAAYVISVPTYFGGHMTLGLSTDDANRLKTPADVAAARLGTIETRYYTPELHGAAFALPRFIGDALAEAVARPET